MSKLKSPFKFLDSYTKEDRGIFFGREREIEELYLRVFDSKIMLVYGVSGTGKSSLIQCGLANKFQETDWLPITVRRGTNLVESLVYAIRSASVTTQQKKIITTSDFKKGIRSLYLDYYKPVYFIFDQFEELFIFGTKEERRSFIHIIKSITETELQCRLIFIIREEYIAGVTEFEKFVPTFFSNRVRIEKMSHRNALEVVKGPCKISGIEIEEGFAETLLETLCPGSEDVELTYLQVFLDRIFRLSSETKDAPSDKNNLTFSISLLQQAGDVSDLLGDFLDDQVSSMDDPETALSLLKAFVSEKGTKRPANEQETVDNMRSLGKIISVEKALDNIQSFIKLRVLRDKDEHGRYELCHDALAEMIYEKFSLAEKELLEIKQLIETAYQYYLKRKTLLSNEDLIYLSDKDSQLNLNAELHDFVEASRNHQKYKIKTVKRLTLISAIAFFILIGILGYFAFMQWEKIDANYIAIKSLNKTTDPVESFRLAGLSWERNHGVLQKEALLKSLYEILNHPVKDSLMKVIAAQFDLTFDPAPVNINYAECSKDNKCVFGYGDSLMFIWNMTGRLDRIISTGHFPIIDMKISDDAWYVGAISCDSLLTVWYAPGKVQFSCFVPYNQFNPKQAFKFTSDNRIIALGKGHDAVLLDLNGNELEAFDRHNGGVNAVDVTADFCFIATASSDKTINIWYLNSITGRYDFYSTLDWHKDTVWSVSFANRNRIVISTSADSMTAIGTINNEKAFSLSGNEFYCGEFTPSDRGFINMTYKKNIDVNTTALFALSYRNPRIEIKNTDAPANKIAGGTLEGVSNGFSFIKFAKDDDYYVYSDSEHSTLVDNRLIFEYDRSPNYKLVEIEGSKPFFTPDGKTLLTIKGNSIKAYPIDIEQMYNVSKNIRIFNNIN